MVMQETGTKLEIQAARHEVADSDNDTSAMSSRVTI